MPSKLKKAIAAVKDQTSISLAKVGAGAESSSLEVSILKATTHEETPVEERHVTGILQRVSSNRCYAGPCARAIGRRVGRTRSWVVAVKSLMLVLRIFQDGDPHFPKEVYNAMKRGYKILNLSSFRDDSSTSCPWDFTAFVRTFSLYLDERLDCFLTGKLQRRSSMRHGSGPGYAGPVVRDMKPSKLLDRIAHWQKLLDRAIATRPTGAARTNRLVQTCLYAIVQETFELYKDISDGLALLLDSFFHLQYNNCTSAYQTCVKASKQFEELCSFYDLCKSVGVGRTSEYPSVHKVSEELLDTLQEFLKDQSSFPSGANGRTPGGNLPLPGPSLSPESGSVGRRSDRAASEYGGSSLEDLMSADGGYSPERYSDPGGEKPSSQMEELYYSTNDTASVRSDPTDNRGVNSVFDLLSLDDNPSTPPEPNNEEPSSSSSKQGWELALFEATTPQPSAQTSNSSTSSSPWIAPELRYNPFLHDPIEINGSQTGSISGANKGVIDLFGPSGSFPTHDLGLEMGNFPPTFNANFSNTNTNTNTNTNANANANANASFSASFPRNLESENSSIRPPTFQPNFGNSISNGNSSNNDLSDLFGDLGSGNSIGPKHDHYPSIGGGNVNLSPAFQAPPPSSYTDPTNAIVLYGQPGNSNDQISAAPTFKATPTFGAASSESNNGLQNENDPFGDGGALDQQSVSQQQQLWLQNQNKIMSKLLT